MSGVTPLPEDRIAALRCEFPVLPDAYFEYLSRIGWGEAASGRMIYDGPMPPSEIYGDRVSNEHFVVLGDDFQGYCLAVRLSTGMLGELSPEGVWEEWPVSESFDGYVEA